MKNLYLSHDKQANGAVSALFRKAPVLVEVRFPNMGTSPDWRLCEDEADFGSLLERLGPGVELHLNSVWDLKYSSGELTLRK